MLFVTSALIVITNVKNDNIIASGSPSPNNNGIGLNYSYIWEVTRYLSNATHSYPPGMIPKGRAFGSWGCENYSRDYIYTQMKYKLNLSNVKVEKLEPLAFPFNIRYYASLVRGKLLFLKCSN